MMTVTTGFQILPRQRAVPSEFVEAFRDIPVANISDVMGRLIGGGAALRPLHRKGGLAGVALTVRTRPGDNLLVHYAINAASAGDVVVVDAGGDLSNAIVGEMMLAHAQKQGLAGIIINGAVRDLGWIKDHDFPVYAKGVTHRGPYKDGPGEVNVPVALSGMKVEPGDLVLGDDDGVVCIPFGMVEKVLQDARAKAEAEAAGMAAILNGTSDRSWVEKRLRDLGCVIAP